MLLGLIFRGIAFEFHFRANTAGGRRAWDVAFLTGSTVAALCQGMTLSFLLQGIYVVNRQYAGGWLDWLDAFTALCGRALVVGYTLQGACWLILRTEGKLLHSARRYASTLGLALLVLIFVISLGTPVLNDVYWKHWFIYPQVLFTAPVPILVVLVAGHSGARSGGITT